MTPQLKVENVLRRPLYREFAWAYDLIVAGPVSSRCDFWEAMASRRGVQPGSRVLDAGCGTGYYAVELARRGYLVTGLDLSSELICVARKKLAGTPLRVDFQVGDVLQLPGGPRYDGILCRGVLNDIIDDADRQEAFFSFARALRKGGVLTLDVREWHATARRKEREPIFERRVEAAAGRFTFRSVTRLDYGTRRLLVKESHIVEQGEREVVTEYDFVMRCWTEEELHDHLTHAGFDAMAYFGDYDQKKAVGSSDRILAVASLKP